MLKYQNGPGSNNGTGLFQTLCGLKVRELYEAIAETEAGRCMLTLSNPR